MSPSDTKQEKPAGLPIRRGLYLEGRAGSPPQLLASRCQGCGALYYPKVDYCPDCRDSAGVTETPLEGRGRLATYTIVKRGLPGFDSPYALACVELEAGPSLIVQLDDWTEADLRLGLAVEMVIGRVKTDAQGREILGPKFRPVRAGAEVTS